MNSDQQSSARVLVVDDERSIRTVLRAFLRKAGHDVDVAEDAKIAQDLLADGEYDVVVSDIVLPGLSGVALLHAIREHAPDVQVIMMTGEPTVETAIETLRAGAFDYLAKPVSKEAIVRTVGHATRLSTSERERVRLGEENRQYQENLERLVEKRTEELRESQDQLRQVQKLEAIGLLAGGVAHDFNNLLMVIGGSAEFLREEAGLSATAREDVEEVSTAVVRATKLTSQLLAFSRKQELRQETVDVRHIIENVSKMLGRLLGEDIQMRIETTDDPCVAHVDPSQIEQVIMNLSVNARDAMPKGGRLLVEVDHTVLTEDDISRFVDAEGMTAGGYIAVSVTDTGSGIGPAMQGRIFDPFYTTKAQGEGTGLGLSTVYGIVKQHGGHVAVYSEVGAGTTFRIYLPRVADESVDSATGAAEVLPCGKGETILFAEDDLGVRRVGARVLRKLGYTVLAAEDVVDAVRLAREHRGEVKLLLTDVIMPDASGPELAQRVLPICPALKVVYASGYPADHLARHGLEGDDLLLLRKPFVQQELAAVIHRALNG